jgi:hypothetical protein
LNYCGFSGCQVQRAYYLDDLLASVVFVTYFPSINKLVLIKPGKLLGIMFWGAKTTTNSVPQVEVGELVTVFGIFPNTSLKTFRGQHRL